MEHTRAPLVTASLCLFALAVSPGSAARLRSATEKALGAWHLAPGAQRSWVAMQSQAASRSAGVLQSAKRKAPSAAAGGSTGQPRPAESRLADDGLPGFLGQPQFPMRPRALLTPSDLDALPARREADPAGFAAVVAAARQSSWNSWDEIGLTALARVIAYYTDPQTYADCREAARALLVGSATQAYADAALAPYHPDGSPAVVLNGYEPGGDPNMVRPRLFWAAVIYDLVADWLTPEERQRAVRWIVAEAQECQNGSGEAGELDNYYYRAMSAVGMAGIAIYDDDPDTGLSFLAWAESRWERYRTALAWPSNQIGNPAEGDGGYLPEGPYYSINGWYIPFYLQAVENFLGERRWEQVPYYADRMIDMLMEYHPGFIGYNQLGPMDLTRAARNPIAVGDTNRNLHAYQFFRRWEEELLVKAYSASYDPGLQRRARQLNWWLSLPPVNHIWEPTYRVMEYLLRDPLAPVTKPDVLAWRTGFGHVFLRSKWGTATDPEEAPSPAANAADENATHIYYHAGPLLTGHEHLDQGSFQIWKRGDLAIDSGIYDDNVFSDHMRNWTRRTAAHNSLLILQPGEQWRGDFTGSSSGDVNDGGQRGKRPSGWGVSLQERTAFPERFDTAWINQFVDTPWFAYIDSDITQAYNTDRFSSERNRPKVDRVTRQLVYLRPTDAAGEGPDFLIVFDRVAAKDGSYRKKWLLHFAGTNGPQSEPEVLKDAAGTPATPLELSPGTEILYQDGSVVRCDAPDRRSAGQITAGDGDGRLVLQTLLPCQRTIRKVGRFPWVDGVVCEAGTGALDGNQVRLLRANRRVQPGNGRSYTVEGEWTIRFRGPDAIDVYGPEPSPGETQIAFSTTRSNFDTAAAFYIFELPASAWRGTFADGDVYHFQIHAGKATWVGELDGGGDSHEAVNSHEPKYGEWHIEIEPPPGNPTDYFLNVLYPTVNADGSIPPARLVAAADGRMLGAAVADRLVLFGKDGQVGGEIRYDASGLASPTRHLLVDLPPNTSYQITVNGAPQTAQSDEHGALSFETSDSAVSVTVTPQ
jgi:Heparinase II/III-like protein